MNNIHYLRLKFSIKIMNDVHYNIYYDNHYGKFDFYNIYVYMKHI